MGKQAADDFIDKFGKIIDQFLLEGDIALLIRLPKGSMDPIIKSSFDNMGLNKDVMDLYVLLGALANVVANLIEDKILDPERVEDMLDGIFDMAKKEILKEAADERQQLEDVLQRIDKVNNELMALDDGPVDMDSLMQALEALSIKINDILEMDENKTARDFETEISLLGSMSKEELTEMIKGGSR